MKAFPNIQNWRFKKLHKPGSSFFFLKERKIFLPLRYEYAIQALEAGKLTYKQLESCRRTLRRGLGKAANIYFCIFPSVPVSKKPIAARMGKGKGGLSHWIAIIKCGKVLIEVKCSNSLSALMILTKASTKLPIRTKILTLLF